MNNTRIIRFRIAGFVGLLAAMTALSPVRAEVDVTACVPKEIVFIARIQWSRAIKTPVGSEILNRFGDKYAKIADFCQEVGGFDLAQVRTMWIMTGHPNTGILVLNGPFVADDIRSAFGAAPGVMVEARPGCLFAARFPDAKTGKMKLVAVLDEGTLAVGEAEWVGRFLDAWRGKHPKANPKSPNLVWLSNTRQVCAATVLAPLDRWPKFDKNIAAFIEGAWLALDLNAGVDLQLTVQVSNPKVAQGVAEILRGLSLVGQGIQKQKPLPAPVRSILRGPLEFKADKNQVTATTRLSPEAVQSLLSGGPAPH